MSVRASLTLSLLLACADDDTPPPVFPESYAGTYTEVRNCRQSGDHDLNMIRVLADPVALPSYTERAAPFPTGSVVLKEEYDFGDFDCSGAIKQWTVMQKLETGSSPSYLDWVWQTVDPLRVVEEHNPVQCAGCHNDCLPPDGFDGTCTVP